MKKLLVILAMSLMLISCGNSTFDKAMEQGKLALANGEFDKALSSFELALEEKSKDKEAAAFHEQLQIFSKVQRNIENKSWDEALTQANTILQGENVTAILKKALEQYIQTAEANKAQYTAVSERIQQIKGFVDTQGYEEARTALEQLKQDATLQAAAVSFAKELEELTNTVNEQMQKKQAEEAAAKKKLAEAAEASKYPWKGTYLGMLSGNHFQTRLLIKSLSGNTFNFTIKSTSNYWVEDANGGGWNGHDEQTFDGTATVTKGIATYTNDKGCHIQFQYTNEGIEVTVTNCAEMDDFGEDLYVRES